MGFNKITAETLVPLGIVGSVLIVLIGSILWLTEVQATGKANTVKIAEVKENQVRGLDDISRKLDDINTRLSKMEGYLYKGR